MASTLKKKQSRRYYLHARYKNNPSSDVRFEPRLRTFFVKAAPADQDQELESTRTMMELVNKFGYNIQLEVG